VTDFPETAVLLPVYRPGPRLVGLVTDLPETARVVVVDDGSGEDSHPFLTAAEALGAEVLRLDVNRGKGIALKTGFRHLATERPGLDVISADADGQHSAADIARLAARTGRGRIVLGVRRFHRMPPRSRIGNTITRAMFRAATGREVSDTQTGLRAYPADLLERLCTIPGERFEYEMNVLLAAAASDLPLEEVEIPTTYLNDNAASHFDGLADSMRVYRPLLRYALLGGIRP
jgi:glycosyltransferase involved in cell wall biosynthesis